MPEVIFNGPEGRLEGRYHHAAQENAPIALVLHPHPQYGGTMNNKVVYNLYQLFVRRGFSVLRFNFRGIGRSEGEYDNGQGELSDAASALDWMQAFNRDAPACWIAGFMLGFFNTELPWKVLALRLEYLGIIGAPVFFFLFVASYVQIRLPPGWPWMIYGPAVAMLLLVLTFTDHGLLYLDYGTVVLDSGFVVFDKEYGPAFYFWLICSYVLMMASVLVLGWGVARMPERYRFQATVLALIIAVVMIANITFVTGYNPIAPYDPTPLTFLAAAVLVLINMRTYRFLEIVPVAHHLVFEQVPTGVIVLNERDIVIDVNGVAESVFGVREEMLGEPLERWLSIERSHREGVPLGEDEREFDINITPFTDRTGHTAGKLVLLHDMTAHNEMSRRQDALIAELRKALADVRMLEGMLPICASCKKIRTEDDEWQDLETYLNEHSSARLSHSICPVCAKRLYPGYETD